MPDRRSHLPLYFHPLQSVSFPTSLPFCLLLQCQSPDNTKGKVTIFPLANTSFSQNSQRLTTQGNHHAESELPL